MNESVISPAPERKKRIFSAIQPSGMLTIGNYFGALKNWAKLEASGEFDCIYAVADLHAITVRQEPAEFRHRILETYAVLLALGIDPARSIVFLQSQVHEHAELAWVLDCFTQFGELSRMTQFKDKSASHADNVNAGLFTYPALMAADILLYQTDLVPVGEDQKQHLELSRTIADRMNGVYGNLFTVPEPYITKACARVKSLQDPTKKMSKSDPNANAWVAMLDKPEDIRRKFKRAVTDSEAKVCMGEGRDAINNLIELYCACTGETPDAVAAEFEGKGYGDFKAAVGDAVIEELRPIREKHDDLMKNKDYLMTCAQNGAEAAERIAARTLAKVMKKVGFVR